MDENGGVLRLKPAWVPRSFCRPARRIKLHPDDYYTLGLTRGGIDERWLASTTRADNGPGTPEDEGLSYAVSADGKDAALLLDVVAEFKDQVIGKDLWDGYGRWPMFSKFFDNLGPLPHHVHHGDKHAALTGQAGKPEMYFFPAQMNNYGGEFPFTFFGIDPGVSKDAVRKALGAFTKGDNKLLDLSRAYKLTLDTGWDVPPGLLHAPGSLCTYEPQFSSDVYAMYQSVLFGGHCVPESLLWKNCPPDRAGDVDFLMEVIDWPLNTDPDFRKNRYMEPIAVADCETHREEWVCYRAECAGANRLTVFPGQTVTVRDEAAYGAILLQGCGTFGGRRALTPTLIRYGGLTDDEFFVSFEAARSGVKIENASRTENLVMLKHFAKNPERDRFMEKFI